MVMAWLMADCSTSGATTRTCPNSEATCASALMPGLKTPSSLLTRILIPSPTPCYLVGREHTLTSPLRANRRGRHDGHHTGAREFRPIMRRVRRRHPPRCGRPSSEPSEQPTCLQERNTASCSGHLGRLQRVHHASAYTQSSRTCVPLEESDAG